MPHIAQVVGNDCDSIPGERELIKMVIALVGQLSRTRPVIPSALQTIHPALAHHHAEFFQRF